MLRIKFPTSKYNWLTDIVILGLFISTLYVLWLGSYPLFTPDEGRYSEVAREMLATGDYITPRVDGVAFLDKPIFYYWLQAAAMWLFGVNEWAIRTFPALLGIFGCLLTYFCGRLLFNRLTGLLSAIILATTPLYFGGAHYADLNLEVTVFISTTLLLFITASQQQGRLRTSLFFGSYLFAALAFLTKGLIGIAFPSLIIGSWIILLWRWDILKKIHLPAGITLFILLTLPWYILAQKANPEFLHYFFVTQQVTRFLSAGEFNNKTPFWFYLPIILVGAFPWTIFIIQALGNSIKNVWHNRNQHATELFLLLWLGIIFCFFSIPRSKTVGYILPVFPVIALLIGNYLSLMWGQISQKKLYINIFNFILFSILLAFLLLILPQYKKFDFDSSFILYLKVIACIFILSAIIAMTFVKKKNLIALFTLCTICSALSLITLTKGAAYINTNSVKSLAINLKSIIKPQDEVITYLRYYQDLPLYLKRRITIVADWQSPDIVYKDNWVRELWNGMAFQKTDAWLINENNFWQRWNSTKHIFVFVNENYFAEFKTHTQRYFYLGRRNDIILLSNEPTAMLNAS